MKYSIGEVIRRERNRQGLTQEELAYGICSTAWLSQIESGVCVPTVGKFEKIMQKLGKSASQYIYYKSEKELEVDRLKIEFRRQYYIGNINESDKCLRRLKELAPDDDQISKQFILLYEVVLNQGKRSIEESINLLYESIFITIPGFNINEIDDYLLTQEELVIIMNIALLLKEDKGEELAIAILIKLKQYSELHKFNYEEQVRIYPVVTYNLSKWQGAAGQVLECIATAQSGIDFCIKNDTVSMLGYLLFNKGYALAEMKSKELAIECVKQAYYLFLATKQEIEADSVKRYMQENLDVFL